MMEGSCDLGGTCALSAHPEAVNQDANDAADFLTGSILLPTSHVRYLLGGRIPKDVTFARDVSS